MVDMRMSPKIGLCLAQLHVGQSENLLRNGRGIQDCLGAMAELGLDHGNVYLVITDCLFLSLTS